MRRARICRALSLLLLAGGGAAAEEPAVVAPRAEDAGIAVAALPAAREAPSILALGTVLDPAPLISLSGQLAALAAQLAGANAKLALEQKQMDQASALYGHGQVISLTDYRKAAADLAATQAQRDEAQAKRTALLGQIQAEWGDAMAAAIRENSGPLPLLGSGKAMLVGLSLPPGRALPQPPTDIAGEAAGADLDLHLIGPVPKMVGGFPGQAFLYQAPASPAIPIGSTVSAAMPSGPPRAGVVVPWSAVVWRHGRAVVFRKENGDRFEPVPIPTEVPARGGYFVSAGLEPGDRIVVRGAGLLLGAGRPQPHTSEDADED